ncbi:putative Calmodulin-binding domain, plant [Senna tora]|uniref:Putative Calmodulin-binding domain, plant n=1 Tax=Senna tora TaxID=362788 RepID=A0A834SKU5_9FABA|nr:putative Calmodulin-binding domain, plant [Senna tora]
MSNKYCKLVLLELGGGGGGGRPTAAWDEALNTQEGLRILGLWLMLASYIVATNAHSLPPHFPLHPSHLSSFFKFNAPTPSCHDTCKYGIKHAIQTKPWNAKNKKVPPKPKAKNTKIPEQTVPSLLGIMEKSRTTSSKPCPNSKIVRPNSPVMTSEETEISLENASTKSLNTQTHRKIVGSKQRKTSLIDGKKVSLPPTSPSSSSTSSQTRKGVIRKEEVKHVESNNDAKTKSEKVVNGQQTMEGSRRRSFKRKGVDGRKIDGLNLGSEKVLLRHQSLESKKVEGRTYNNVIEETASQLAEVRKSKVKALVGAFETVISLDHQQATPIQQISITC